MKDKPFSTYPISAEIKRALTFFTVYKPYFYSAESDSVVSEK